MAPHWRRNACGDDTRRRAGLFRKKQLKGGSQMSDVKGHDTSYEWKIILLLSITFGLVGLDRFILPVILQSPNSTMGKDLGLTPADGGSMAGYLGMAWGVSAFV